MCRLALILHFYPHASALNMIDEASSNVHEKVFVVDLIEVIHDIEITEIICTAVHLLLRT